MDVCVPKRLNITVPAQVNGYALLRFETIARAMVRLDRPDVVSVSKAPKDRPPVSPFMGTMMTAWT